jgi:hypothetical protein
MAAPPQESDSIQSSGDGHGALRWLFTFSFIPLDTESDGNVPLFQGWLTGRQKAECRNQNHTSMLPRRAGRVRVSFRARSQLIVRLHAKTQRIGTNAQPVHAERGDASPHYFESSEEGAKSGRRNMTAKAQHDREVHSVGWQRIQYHF